MTNVKFDPVHSTLDTLDSTLGCDSVVDSIVDGALVDCTVECRFDDTFEDGADDATPEAVRVIFFVCALIGTHISTCSADT